LFITLRYVTLRTSQNLAIYSIYIYIYIYYMGGTMGSIWPQAEIKKNKRKAQKLANVCDIVRKALRKNT
jgi:hypothetical protein